ncbi:carboxylesterase [Halobacillus salinarum]|uniref:Carboxylesterase n=1 Tax=Halobacillus salinarum TaxID=2932257 RepID=A0ABY4EN42_9BACI|nr:carboxylesterase [Halobacillus salinarum]UOQ45880.1 carboxylesterase [Halobacillus salinarum]
MKIKQPQPFTFEAGERAVLLLHGFTGHSADVRMLGRFLEKNGYTSHAPIYRGHGTKPEDLIDATPEEWWEDVQAGLNHLREKGYDKIAVAGLSLGGVLSLKLGYSEPIKGIVTMCAPMFFDNEEQLTEGFQFKARQYKQLQGKDKETIEAEVKELLDDSKDMFQQLGRFINEVHDEIDQVYTPTLVVQAEQDEMINTDSASYIYHQIEADHKDLKWYKNSGHIITMDKEKDQLHKDILEFLESLDWS